MKSFTAYRLLFTPLSPIHIGTGDSYNPTNYVIEGDTLHEFDTAALIETLSATDRQAIEAIVNRSPDDGMIRAVQKYFHDRRATLMPLAVHRLPVQPGVAHLYANRVGQIAQQKARGQGVIHQLAIDRTAYNPVTRFPVLMGSSIKGAIRTALLDQVNHGAPRLPQEREGLHEFQGRLFRYYEAERRKMFLERDPLRLVHISDAAWQCEPGLPATEIVFAVNRKKAPAGDRQGNQRSTKADSGPLQLLECIPALRYHAFAGQLNMQLLGNVNKPEQVPATDLRFDMSRIAQACNAFYRPILQQELSLLSQHGYLDPEWGKALTEVLSSSLLEDRGAFLLRVGRHSGAESLTLNGVRMIGIKTGRGGQKEEPLATTIWLAAKELHQASGLLPFGWLLVEYGPLSHESIPDRLSIKQACERRLGPVRQWAQRLRTQQAEWRRKGLLPTSLPTRLTTTAVPRTHCPWVDDKLAELCSKPGIKPDDALRGTALAEAVRAIEDPTVRADALADIVARWKEKGWWDQTTGGAAKKAKAIYEELLGQAPIASLRPND
ncbi:MAG: RAMP superfamily CRISPR-associated protein [Nitrospira sp.]|nr:RAMP superfamily CRISPR-associated protein [Nitrospira sp.]